MQRLLQTGGDPLAALSEAAMVVDYYSTMEGGGAVTDMVLSGELAQDREFTEAVHSVLELPISILSCAAGVEWTLCSGAAKTKLDFGDPAMNRVKSASQQLGVAWHYAFVLFSGALLAGAIVMLLTGKSGWDTELRALQSRDQLITIQAAQAMSEASEAAKEAETYQGYAENYQRYLYTYLAYSNDWDGLFASLRTYNDNLQLALGELETILPTTTSVNQIYVHEYGMFLQFACPSKEEAAYVYSQIRNMQYATLAQTSDLTVGPPASWMENMKPVVQSITEAPPEEGGGTNTDLALEILSKLSEFSPEVREAALKLITGGELTVDEMETLYKALPEEQSDELVDCYAGLLSERSDFEEMDELLEEATLGQRKAAIRTMFEENPMADYRFLTLVKEDSETRLYADQILFYRFTNVRFATEHEELANAILHQDKEEILDRLPELLDILTQDEGTVDDVESLMRTDVSDSMTRLYAYYLGVEMERTEKKTLTPQEGLKLIKDVFGIDINLDNNNNNNNNNNNENNNSAPLSLEDLQKLYNYLRNYLSDPEQTTFQNALNHYDSLSDSEWQTLISLINAADQRRRADQTQQSGTGTGGTAGTAAPADDRIFFTVFLVYKQDLIEEELERKGLSIDDKVPVLEVTE